MNRKRKILSVIIYSTIIIAVSQNHCDAQSNTIYHNYFLHQTLINPAIAGSEYFPVANISHQKQWMGISDSPQTLVASTSLRMGNFDFYNPKMFINKSNLKTYEKIGMGLGLYSDKNGPITSRGVNLAYAYHLAFKDSRLSFGISGIAEQIIFDETMWDPVNPGDPILGDNKESFFNYNANFGVLYYNPVYFVGFAVNNMLPLEDKSSPEELIKQDFLLHGGYIIGAIEELKFEPSINLRMLDYEKFEFDIQLKMYIQHIHWVAVAYRSYNAINIYAGYRIGKVYIAYSYEANLSPVIKYSAGTHGINIGVNLGVRRLEGF